MDPYDPSVIWIVVLGFIVAFFLAFGVGANDVANSFGTSVGSKVLTLRQACILATIFEIAGALTLGHQVSSTIRTEMIDINLFSGEETKLMIGFLSALIGGAIWNLIATFAGLPISGTHSIVGAIIGFSIVAKNFSSVHWLSIIKIVASWFVSPILSGLVSLMLYFGIKTTILNKDKPLESGLISLPIFYATVIGINTFSIIYSGPYFLSSFNWWMTLCVALIVAIIVANIVWFFVVPRLRRKITSIIEEDVKNVNTNEKTSKINKHNKNQQNLETNGNIFTVEVKDKDIENGLHSEIALETDSNDSEDDKPEVAQLFTFLQILTACFGSFAHGGNDVSNAIGPLVAIVLIYFEGSVSQKGETPWYILLYGGIGISIGLWVWGRKVIKTMGNDLTKITPSSGFTIEIGAALTVLLASKIGLPISTTHCKVGSVVMVGRIRSKQGVNWKLFRNITIAWVLTVPLTAICSAIAMALLQLSI